VSDELLLGSGQSFDILDGWMALFGVWDKMLTQAGVEALDNNWATSDWQNHAEGAPVCLIHCNVAGASLVDLAGQATNVTATGTVMDFEPIGTWVFDGTPYTPGGGPPIEYQNFRPSADLAAAGWTPTPLWSRVDEDAPAGDVITGVSA
jgi:hypothetical protein